MRGERAEEETQEERGQGSASKITQVKKKGIQEVIQNNISYNQLNSLSPGGNMSFTSLTWWQRVYYLAAQCLNRLEARILISRLCITW